MASAVTGASGPDLVIVNTGTANISSVRFAIQRLGYAVSVSDEAERIQIADKVFLPGVGAAPAAMSTLRDKGLVPVIKSLSQPVLGICLGMQLMAEHSEEGDEACLGLIPTRLSRMQVADLRLPHMGWNAVTLAQQHPLFDGLDGAYFYFVHSYAAPASAVTLASCDYHQPFTASFAQNNFHGVQFHPERSSSAGAKLLQNFIEKV